MSKIPKIVVVGGGTGTFVVLSGLKKYPVELAAVVTMADSGGSNRVLRDEFGLLPTSDIRQCMVALAEDNGDSEILRQLFMYRYSKGRGIAGMTFGNLFMAALADVMGSQKKAIEETGRILRIKGKILPVCSRNVDLVAEYEDRRTVIGEHEIDEPKHDGKIRIKKLSTRPKARIDRRISHVIEEADLVVLGPGDLYTSVLANLVLGGFPEALAKCKGKVCYVVNLMTRWGQTYGFTVEDHIREIEKYVGKNILDTVLINSQRSFPQKILDLYKKEGAHPVVDNYNNRKIRIIRRNFVADKLYKEQAADKLKRSIIRHDSANLAGVLYRYLLEHV